MDDVEHDYELCLDNSVKKVSELGHSKNGDKMYIFFDSPTTCVLFVSRKLDDVKYIVNSNSEAV